MGKMRWIGDLIRFPFQDAGYVIHFTRDEYGAILVIDDGEYRMLNFDSPFEQSCMSMRFPFQLVHQYTQYMLLALSYCDPNHVTLFGLGGGSLLRSLHYLMPNIQFEVVELRKSVLDIAKEYFCIPTGENVSVTLDDASLYIHQMPDCSTNLIFSDMYDAYHMVEAQVQKQFLSECSRVLSGDGWLVINLHSLPKNRAEFLEKLKTIFPTILLSANTANTILFASNMHPESIFMDARRIEWMESSLKQNFKQLTSRILQLKPHSTPV